LIDSFKTLVNFFATSRPHHLTSIALVNIRQGKGESLWAFLERFNQVALQIWNLNLEVALHHKVMALRPGPFADSLCKKSALNMSEMRVRAAKFIRLEELRDFGGQMKAEHQIFPTSRTRPEQKKDPSFPRHQHNQGRSGYPSLRVTHPLMPTGGGYPLTKYNV